MNPYLGTGPRSEVSSESHKCPYQSIIFSNLWSRIKTQEAAKHFYLFLLQHPKHHLDSFQCTLFVLGTVVAVTSNHCHVLGGALTHLHWSTEPPPAPAPPAVLSTSRSAAWHPQPKPLSLHRNIQDKYLSEMFRALDFLRIFCWNLLGTKNQARSRKHKASSFSNRWQKKKKIAFLQRKTGWGQGQRIKLLFSKTLIWTCLTLKAKQKDNKS